MGKGRGDARKAGGFHTTLTMISSPTLSKSVTQFAPGSRYWRGLRPAACCHALSVWADPWLLA